MSLCTYTFKDPSGKDVTLTGQAAIKAWLVAGGLRYLRAANDVKASRARGVTDTPEFKAWFGDSKVVDASGKPLVVYHGSPRSAGKPAFGDEGNSIARISDGRPFFITDNKKYAEDFARGGSVTPLYASIKNPADLREADLVDDLIEIAKADADFKSTLDILGDPESSEDIDGSAYFLLESKDVMRELRRRGFDGAVMDEDVELGVTSYAAFSPEQLKSATGNNGAFDPADADIRRSAARLSDFEPGEIGSLLSKTNWAILTAENPMGQPASPKENRDANARLEADLKAGNHEFKPLVGRYGGDEEHSYAVTNITHDQALALGRKYNQDAVLTRDGFVYQDGSINPAGGIEVFRKPPENYYSKIGDTIFRVNIDFDTKIQPDGVTKSTNRPQFFSQLQRTIEQVPARLDNMAAPMWAQWLKSNAPKLGIKQDEITWSGIEDFLKLQGKAKVSKSDLATFLGENGVKLEEVTLGYKVGGAKAGPVTLVPNGTRRDAWGTVHMYLSSDGVYSIENGIGGRSWQVELADQGDDYDDEGSFAGDFGSEQEVLDFLNGERGATFDGFDGPPAQTKYEGYRVPGGDNYREVLVTLPERRPLTDAWRRAQEQYGDSDPRTIEAKKAARAEAGAKSGGYKSKHWDQPNVLVHFRADDRTDADGNKVLFLHDVQSDFGQDAKKHGFAGDPVAARFPTREAAEMAAKIAGRADVVQVGDEWSFTRSGGVPRAPFIGDTKAWVSLGLKRAIMMAVEAGQDRVAVVSGEQAADMFDLSKQVNSITAYKLGDGKYKISAIDSSGKQLPAQSASSDAELEGMIGKELATKVASQPGQMETYTGLDLKVGGEGMKAFYDQIVPQVMRDVAKKLGGKVVEAKIDTAPSFNETDPALMVRINETSGGQFRVGVGSGDERVANTLPTREAAQAWADEQLAMARDRRMARQTAIEITPAMRDTVLSGVPLFSRKRNQQTLTPEFKAWFGKSVVTEDGKAGGEPRVVYHGTGQRDDFSEFSWSDRGIWFTEDNEEASYYANWSDDSGRGKARVMPVYLAIENPYIPTRREVRDWRDATSADEGFEQVERDIVKKAKERGHDGIDFGQGYWVAFDPEQVKSAVGNGGGFDPTNPDITKSRSRIIGDTGRKYTPEQLKMFTNVGREVTKPTMKERIQALRKDFGKKLTQGIVDQFAPIKDISEQGYLLARLSKGTAGAMEALLHHGKLSIKDGAYDADMSGGFVDRVGKALHGELDDFLFWVAANRAERLKAEGKENLFGDADIAAGKSLATGKADFDYILQHDIAGKKAGETTRDRVLIYRDAHKTFNEFQDNVLQMAEESGLIDSEARKLWKDDFYVPFYRVSEEEGGFVNVTGSKGLVRQNAFKKLKGGTNKLNDLTANTLMNWSHLIDAAAKNRAAKETLVAAEQMGAAIEAPEATARSMAKAAGAKDQVVWFAEGGKKRFFVVEDPLLMTALTSLEFAGLRGPLMDALSTFKHALTVGVTASPAFKIRNLIRDSIQAIAISPLGANPVQNLRDGIKASARDSQTYVSALASGGLIKFGTSEGKQADAIRKLIERGVDASTILDSDDKVRAFYNKAVLPVIEAYQEIGNRGEEINRAALYSQLTKQGLSHANAALMARGLMDFSLQGSFSTVRFLTQVVPFLNARLQGLYRLGEGAAENPAKFAAVLGAVTLTSLALMAAYHDDDDWKKREDWDLNGFFWFKIGGTAWRVPMPFEVGALSRVATLGVELITNDEMTQKRFLKNIGALLTENLSMNPIPQAVKPVLDLYANKDSFTGRPIESLGMERVAPEYRFTNSTSMVGRGVSSATGGAISPVQFDHLAKAYFGWLGSFVVGGADMLARPLTDEPSRPAADYWKLATQGIGQELTSAGSRYVSNMYDQAKEIEQAVATYKRLVKDAKTDEAAKYLLDHAELINAKPQVEPVKKIVSGSNERIREIEKSDMSPEDKKAAIIKLRQQQDMAARRIPTP